MSDLNQINVALERLFNEERQRIVSGTIPTESSSTRCRSSCLKA